MIKLRDELQLSIMREKIKKILLYEIPGITRGRLNEMVDKILREISLTANKLEK